MTEKNKEPLRSSPSLDQASLQPLLRSLRLLRPINDFVLIIKTLVKPQHTNRMIKNQYESQKSKKHVSLRSPEEADKFIHPMNSECLRKQAFETTVRFCCADGICYEKRKKMEYEKFCY